MADFLFRCHRDYDGPLQEVATAGLPNDTAFSFFRLKAEREWQIQALATLEDGVPASSLSILVT